MEKAKKLYGKIVATCLLLLGLITSTVSATEGEGATIAGIDGVIFGYLMIVAGAVMVYLIAKKGASKLNKNFAVVLGITGVLIIAGGVYMSFYTAPEDPSAGQAATTTIEWDIGVPTADQGNVSISGKTITIRCGVNATADALTMPAAYGNGETEKAMVSPVLNWSLTPRDTNPFTVEDITANTKVFATFASKVTISGTDYSFFDTTTGVPQYAALNWTDEDGGTDFEEHPTSVVVGETEWVNLRINYNRVGLSNMAEWDSHSFTVSIAGETYTIILTAVGDYDNL